MTAPHGVSTFRLWFRPALIGLHVFMILVIGVCIVAGLWQMGVYDSRKQDEQADKQHVPTVAFASLKWGPDDAFVPRLNHRPVTITGHFAPARDQVWVSGKTQHGSAGFWLVAPFVVDGGSPAVLVVRGWSSHAGELPAVPATTGIRGVIEPGEGTGAPLDSHRVIGTLRIPALINSMPYDLYSGFVTSTSASTAEGLTLATPPLPGAAWTTGLRNLMYSLQWWVFAAFALLMWWRMGTEAVAAGKQKVA